MQEIKEKKYENIKNDKKKGVLTKILRWISSGTEKASKNGAFCNT